MNELTAQRRFVLPADALAEIRKQFAAGRADETETAATIKAVHAERGYMLDPHSAVGVAVARRFKRESTAPLVELSTAHPAKFPEAVAAATGVHPELPPRFSDLLDREERITRLPANVEAVAKFVTERSRANAGAAA
jgi:threonine synthase